MGALKVIPRTELKQKPTDESKLGFGKITTDYMLKIDYSPAEGWHDVRIEPYGPLAMDPANTSLHYGQLIFEGLKAYKDKNGEIVMFRPKDNIKRLNLSASRFCIPEIDVDSTVEAIAQLVKMEEAWIPTGAGTSLYIRPFTIAMDNFLGVHPAADYLFMTILSPVGSYYKEGLSPIGIYVENEYVRSAARGGTGFTKCAGNYAASLIAQGKAAEEGFAQVLWLDSIENKYVEEIGTTNAFFVIDGEVITPSLNGSILPGITRDSALQLLKHWGIPASERRITIDEVVEAQHSGKLQEMFATGTAAVVSPVGRLRYKGEDMIIGGGKIGEISQKLYDGITGIQHRDLDDPFGWVYPVK